MMVRKSCDLVARTHILRIASRECPLPVRKNAQAQDPQILLTLFWWHGSSRKLPGCKMSNLYWLSEEQMGQLRPYFPKGHRVPRVDKRRVLSGLIFISRNGCRWCDAP